MLAPLGDAVGSLRAWLRADSGCFWAVPGPVGHLSFSEILDTSLKVSWQEPLEKNGILTGEGAEGRARPPRRPHSTSPRTLLGPRGWATVGLTSRGAPQATASRGRSTTAPTRG